MKHHNQRITEHETITGWKASTAIKMSKVKTTALKGNKAITISCLILKDTNRRPFQHNMVCNTISQYKNCHTPDVNWDKLNHKTLVKYET